MKPYAILFALVLAFGIVHSQSQISAPSYTVAQANATLSNASATLSSINESGYLIFQPNLTQAYKYLNLGYSVYLSAPNTAVVYANTAVQIAQQQYSNISYYKSVSLVITFAYTVLVLFILLKVMKPVKISKKGKRKAI